MSLGQLEGFTVGVTADRRWEQQSELLVRRGARVIHAPTICTDYLTAEETVRDATMRILRRPPDVFVATTGIGVRAWFEAAQTWGLGTELGSALAQCRLVARGPKAAAALEANGLSGAVRVPTESMREVLDILLDDPGGLQGQVVAIQEYGHKSNPELTARLQAAGADVLAIPVYRWRLPADHEPAHRLLDAIGMGEVDAVTFTSAPAVRNLFALADEVDRGQEARDAFNRRRVVAACVGPVCARTARESGIETPVAPDVGRLGLLVRTLSDELGRRRTVLDGEGAEVTVQGAAVERDGKVVVLSGRQRAVLRRLVDAGGATVGKTALLRGVWRGPPPAARDAHVVEVTVARLRRRLAPLGVSIVAVARRGYRLEAGPLPS